MINDANLYVHVDNKPPIMRFDYPEIPNGNGNYKKFYNIFTWIQILIMSVAVLDRESSE